MDVNRRVSIQNKTPVSSRKILPNNRLGVKTGATPTSTTSLNAGKGRFLKKEALPPKKVPVLNTSLGTKSNRSNKLNISKKSNLSKNSN